MVVTPWKRLSKSILSTAILAFYREAGLIPMGVAESALLPWSERMGFGARKLVQRFRPLYAETPENAKNAEIKQLKARLRSQGIGAEVPAVQPAATVDDAVVLAESQPPKFDWAKMAANLQKNLAEKKQEAPVETAAPTPTAAPRPVVTAARNAHELPKFVVDSMQRAPAAPFATDAGDEDGNGPLAEDGSATVQKPAAKAKSKSKKKEGKKKGQKAQKQSWGPEEEKNLAPKPGESAEEKVDSSNAVSAAGSYVPGGFRNLYMNFLKEAKASGMKHKDACNAWMSSTQRADAMVGLSMAEMKKRKFV